MNDYLKLIILIATIIFLIVFIVMVTLSFSKINKVNEELDNKIHNLKQYNLLFEIVATTAIIKNKFKFWK